MHSSALLSCLLVSTVQSYVLVPLYPPVSLFPRAPGFPLHPYIQVAPPVPLAAPSPDLQYSTLETGLKFSPRRANPENVTEDEDVLSLSLGRLVRLESLIKSAVYWQSDQAASSFCLNKIQLNLDAAI